MSQRPRPQHPQPPQQYPAQENYPPQQGYPQQAPYQQGQYPPQQGYPQQVPPQFAQGQYPPQQGYPQQAPQYYQEAAPYPQENYYPQNQAVAAPRGQNPLKWLAWPFIAFFSFIAWLVAVILQEMLRSIVRFVMGLLLMGIFVTLVGGYVFALWQSNFDIMGALPVMLDNFMGLIGR